MNYHWIQCHWLWSWSRPIIRYCEKCNWKRLGIGDNKSAYYAKQQKCTRCWKSVRFSAQNTIHFSHFNWFSCLLVLTNGFLNALHRTGLHCDWILNTKIFLFRWFICFSNEISDKSIPVFSAEDLKNVLDGSVNYAIGSPVVPVPAKGVLATGKA